MAPKKKGKGKSKSDDGGGADGDGKKKNAPPTEVEREEMRLKITALEQKLASGARKLLEGVMEAHPYNADLLKLAEETLQYLPATDHI